MFFPNCCTGAVGLEAPAQQRHPENGILIPSIFGAVFETPDLATAIGTDLISKIASDVRSWLDAGINFGRVAINLLSVEFNQPDLSDDIIRILSLAMVPAKHFEIEVIERVLLDGRSGLVSDALEKLHQ